ncbi:acylphosphatase [Kroppenstedtia pulmonis]|uniref:Acylphosphatase n=1 Tax=Kroppenstedtia pulmonis TaxID=1380685 RepID=A0A7D4BVX5_9BACL|nr:acylphosphatase [Kroppenstedtia pulmonis]QKG84393.1 acylphosphatase [Kroppenstedtia pulmonis]
MKRVHITVYGRVQGVGFRNYTQQMATRYHICGWVRNRPNGTVEIDAQGDRSLLKSFLAAIHRGSPFSQVSKVEQEEQRELLSYRSFRIKY